MVDKLEHSIPNIPSGPMCTILTFEKVFLGIGGGCGGLGASVLVGLLLIEEGLREGCTATGLMEGGDTCGLGTGGAATGLKAGVPSSGSDISSGMSLLMFTFHMPSSVIMRGAIKSSSSS